MSLCAHSRIINIVHNEREYGPTNVYRHMVLNPTIYLNYIEYLAMHKTSTFLVAKCKRVKCARELRSNIGVEKEGFV